MCYYGNEVEDHGIGKWSSQNLANTVHLCEGCLLCNVCLLLDLGQALALMKELVTMP